VFFCKRWEPFSEVKQRWAPFLPGFSGLSTNQNIWGYAFTPCTTASYTTLPGKSTFGPCLEKILLALMFMGTCSSTEMLKGYMARESLGTPDL